MPEPAEAVLFNISYPTATSDKLIELAAWTYRNVIGLDLTPEEMRDKLIIDEMNRVLGDNHEKMKREKDALAAPAINLAVVTE